MPSIPGVTKFSNHFHCRNPNEVQTRHTSRDVPLEQNCYIEDIAFNEEGNLLYVWATGLSQGWLLCYRIMTPLSIELEARTHYDFVSDSQFLPICKKYLMVQIN